MGKILVIDDSFYDQLIFKEIVESLWPEATVASVDSAEEAIEFLSSNAEKEEKLPDYIFLDIKMPKMDGFGFLNHYPSILQTMQKNPTIFMLSSSLDPSDIEKANASPHVHSFLEKPISDEFIEGLKEK